MKTVETSKKRVDYLAERLKDDALTDAEVTEIQSIIRDQPKARRRLVELLYVSADLRDILNRQSGSADTEQSRKSKMIPFVFGLIAASAAAFALFIGFFNFDDDRAAQSEIVEQVEQNDVQHVAVVTQISNVVWGKGTTLPLNRIRGGQPLRSGIVELTKGLVQIDFYSGASVVLEGPAKLTLEDADLGRLWYGNLRANVPVPARGFKIVTTDFDVVDLGTEFGLSVRADGSSEVHVIDGEIEVLGNQADIAQAHYLITGEALELMDGQRKEITASPELFAAAERFNSDLREKFEHWYGFIAEMRNDPDLLLAYDFQNYGKVWSRKLLNISNFGPRETNGGIVGCRWVEGRWPDKSALKFSNSSHRVRFNLPGEFDDLTLSTWVRINQVNSKDISLLHPETRQERYIHWTLIGPGLQKKPLHMHFSVSDKKVYGHTDRVHYHCDWNLMHNSSLGAWMHLAVVYDSTAGKVTFYQNGETVYVSEINEPRKLSIGTADLGNWPYKEWAKGTRYEVQNLNGAMDEFLVFKRALSADEIAEINQFGSP